MISSAESSGMADASEDARGGEEAAWRMEAEDISGRNQLQNQGLSVSRFDFIH